MSEGAEPHMGLAYDAGRDVYMLCHQGQVMLWVKRESWQEFCHWLEADHLYAYFPPFVMTYDPVPEVWRLGYVESAGVHLVVHYIMAMPRQEWVEFAQELEQRAGTLLERRDDQRLQPDNPLTWVKAGVLGPGFSVS